MSHSEEETLELRKRGRKPLADKPVKWKISLPETLAAKVELLCLDPLTGKPSYSARSRLIARLLERYLALDQNRRKELVEMLSDLGAVNYGPGTGE